MVLKPNDDYGGAGHRSRLDRPTPADWEAGGRDRAGEPYIVQRRVTIPSEPYPSLVDGGP